MSKSRAVASAIQRRSGDPSSQMNSTRPGTSIASQSAFMTATPNVRIAKAPIMEQQQQAPIQSNGLPFTKLTISDAIGLITLRLGKVEQYIIEVQANGGTFSDEPQSNSNKITIDNSILSNIINRLDSLEKKQLNAGSNSNSAVAENGNSEKISHRRAVAFPDSDRHRNHRRARIFPCGGLSSGLLRAKSEPPLQPRGDRSQTGKTQVGDWQKLTPF